MIARLLLVLFCATPLFARINIPDWMKAAAAEPQQKYSEKTKGVILLDERIVTVSAAGEVRTTTRRVTRILSTAGRELALVGVPFDNEMKLIRMRGWSIGPDGLQYQVAERDATEMSVYDGELYADDRMKVLRLPSTEPGSVVGYEYEHIERPYGSQDLWYFQGELPVVRARYSLTLPQGWTYDARWIHREPLEPRQSGSGFVWELAAVPAIEPEPGAPSVAALSGRMGITFLSPAGSPAHRTWNDVARWYASLVAPRAMVTPAIEQ
ncbi:MAG TPA: DUF3857 domain-containing protein, partial [Thermoanaerobaculia bacterium]|nr:DUF3857 domain-containing protein [Thermoanaerobaculia bacterium]